jgi:hypothetical protein
MRVELYGCSACLRESFLAATEGSSGFAIDTALESAIDITHRFTQRLLGRLAELPPRVRRKSLFEAERTGRQLNFLSLLSWAQTLTYGAYSTRRRMGNDRSNDSVHLAQRLVGR